MKRPPFHEQTPEQSGADLLSSLERGTTSWTGAGRVLESILARSRKEEREACARVADEYETALRDMGRADEAMAAAEVAYRIRQRGGKR